MRVVKHWHRNVVDAPSLETFKIRLDGALSNLMEPKHLMHPTGARHLGMPPLRLALRNCPSRLHTSVVCQQRRGRKP
ncbi:hypothetical protein QYF61_002022 [Mycteria americana]|uniref:Uncharacterized protein n=1 Tax=Mycteria americana TaxID=33587 RepID=A0AAN7NKD3_MYCAM|nr:hypothetical protein QYF61_002022 [Mycteria americana]